MRAKDCAMDSLVSDSFVDCKFSTCCRAPIDYKQIKFTHDPKWKTHAATRRARERKMSLNRISFAFLCRFEIEFSLRSSLIRFAIFLAIFPNLILSFCIKLVQFKVTVLYMNLVLIYRRMSGKSRHKIDFPRLQSYVYSHHKCGHKNRVISFCTWSYKILFHFVSFRISLFKLSDRVKRRIKICLKSIESHFTLTQI